MKNTLSLVSITILLLGLLINAGDVSAKTICETGSYGQVTCREIPEEPVLGEHVPVDAGLGDFITPQIAGLVLVAASGALFYRAQRTPRSKKKAATFA